MKGENQLKSNMQITFKKVIEYISLMSISISVFFGFFLSVSINNIDLPLLLNKIPIINNIDLPENPNPIIQSEIIEFNNVDFNNSIVSMRQQGLYYYNGLNQRLKNNFDLMYYGVENFQNKIKFSEPLTVSEFEKLVYILQFDCPTIFHLDLKYNYDIKQGYVVAFYPEYKISKTEYDKKLLMVEQLSNKIIENIKNMTTLEAEIYLHDYILTNTVYDLESKDNDSIYGCLINNKANCKGYTSTFNYLLRKAGITSTSIIGEIYNSSGQTTGHSWNLVEINNEFLYVDICWNDIAPSQEYNDIEYHYAFFNMTYKEMLNNRNISKQLKYLGEIPKTNYTEISYYKQKGLYANNYSEAENIIKNNLPIVLSSQEKYFVIQCKNEETYNQLINNVTDIIKELIQDEIITISSCKYSKIDSGYTLIIHNFS
jgi:hypothetical protein